MKTLIDIFEDMEDIRDNRGKKHKLKDIIVMSIYAILCGNNDSENIADWLELRKEYFIELMNLENGIPSADTFLRVFRAIEPTEFMKLFAMWVNEVLMIKGEQVAIDGKAIRSAADKINNGNIPYIVSGFLTEIGISIGQVKVDSKSNEITAIPELLEILDIEGCVVTIDAIGTQRKIVKQIISKKGHYCLNVKGNQKSLYTDITEYFGFALNDKEELDKMSKFETNSFSHGRIEKRKYYVLDKIDFVNDKEKWEGLKSIGLVINSREIKGVVSVQYKYYIMDTVPNAERFATITRNHWQIENNLHWILDVHFKEDLCKSKMDNSIYNFSLLRKMCYNLVKLDNSFGKISFKKKLNRYIFDLDNLYNLIFNVIPINI